MWVLTNWVAHSDLLLFFSSKCVEGAYFLIRFKNTVIILKYSFRESLCNINDKFQRMHFSISLLYIYIYIYIYIELLHVSASTGHREGAVHMLQKHQTVTLQRRFYLPGPDNR
jgi:hypothetical protein